MRPSNILSLNQQNQKPMMCCCWTAYLTVISSATLNRNEKIASVLSSSEEELVKGIFEKAINNKNMTLAIESLSPDDLPVTVTMSEWMRRMKDMARTGGGGGMSFMGSMPDNYNVAINGNHHIMQKILKAE